MCAGFWAKKNPAGQREVFRSLALHTLRGEPPQIRLPDLLDLPPAAGRLVRDQATMLRLPGTAIHKDDRADQGGDRLVLAPEDRGGIADDRLSRAGVGALAPSSDLGLEAGAACIRAPEERADDVVISHHVTSLPPGWPLPGELRSYARARTTTTTACRRPVLRQEADEGTRTPDPLLTMEVLYRLSYVGGPPAMLAGIRVPAQPPGPARACE